MTDSNKDDPSSYLEGQLGDLSPEDRLQFHLSFISAYLEEHGAGLDFFITIGSRELSTGSSLTNLDHDEAMALLGSIICQACGTEPIALRAGDDPREVANKAAAHIMKVHQSMQEGPAS